MPSFETTDMVIDLCASGMPQLLLGYDSPAAADVLRTSIKSMDIEEAIFIKSTSTTVFVCFDPEPSRRLPCPAPPPKLHYSTFWRGLTRRIYHKRSKEAMQLARDLINELNLNKS